VIGYLLDASACGTCCAPRTDGHLGGHIAAGPCGCASRPAPSSSTPPPAPPTRDDLADELDTLAATVLKAAWRWVDTAQYKLTQKGQHRAAGPLDLLVCATAVHHKPDRVTWTTTTPRCRRPIRTPANADIRSITCGEGPAGAR